MVIFPKELMTRGVSISPASQSFCETVKLKTMRAQARKMAILIPALDPTTGKPMIGKVKLLDEFKKTGQSTENLVALVNKSPVWDAVKNMYILDFRGRVTQASIRNFQAVRAEKEDEIVIQFGKVGDNSYTMDFTNPFSAFQVRRAAFLHSCILGTVGAQCVPGARRRLRCRSRRLRVDFDSMSILALRM